MQFSSWSFGVLVWAVLSFVFGCSTVGAERVAIQAGKSFCVFDDFERGQALTLSNQSDDHPIKVVVRSMGCVVVISFDLDTRPDKGCV